MTHVDRSSWIQERLDAALDATLGHFVPLTASLAVSGLAMLRAIDLALVVVTVVIVGELVQYCVAGLLLATRKRQSDHAGGDRHLTGAAELWSDARRLRRALPRLPNAELGRPT